MISKSLSGSVTTVSSIRKAVSRFFAGLLSPFGSVTLSSSSINTPNHIVRDYLDFTSKEQDYLDFTHTVGDHIDF